MRRSAANRSEETGGAYPISGEARIAARGRPGRFVLGAVAVALALAVTPAVASASFHGYYVSPTGVGGQADGSCATAAYSSIQSAVNAAAAHSVHRVFVCPGTYDEQVTISTSNLTLKGFGGSSIIDPTTAAPTTVTDLDTSQTIVPVVDVTPGTTGVTVTNLAVDGSGLTSGFSFPGCSEDFVGVLYQGASGALNYSTVKNIDLGPGLGGCQAGLAVFVQAGPSGTASVSMNYDTVSNYDKNGITCVDAGATCTLRRVTVTGAGPSSTVGAQNGVQIGPGGASGTLSYVTAAGDDWTGATNSTEPQSDYAAGILLYGAAGTTSISHSKLSGDQTGIEIVASDAALAANTITEGSPIAGSVGVFDVPCDFYCDGLISSPGSNTLSLGDTKVSYAGHPSGSYGIWLGDSWSGNDPWGSDGTVTYTLGGGLQVSGASHPLVFGPRAVAG